MGGNVWPYAKLNSYTGARISPLSVRAWVGLPQRCWKRRVPCSHPWQCHSVQPFFSVLAASPGCSLLSPQTTSALSKIAPGLIALAWWVTCALVGAHYGSFPHAAHELANEKKETNQHILRIKEGKKKKEHQKPNNNNNKKKNSRKKTNTFSKALKQLETSCKRRKDQTKKGKRWKKNMKGTCWEVSSTLFPLSM